MLDKKKTSMTLVNELEEFDMHASKFRVVSRVFQYIKYLYEDYLEVFL